MSSDFDGMDHPGDYGSFGWHEPGSYGEYHGGFDGHGMDPHYLSGGYDPSAFDTSHEAFVWPHESYPAGTQHGDSAETSPGHHDTGGKHSHLHSFSEAIEENEDIGLPSPQTIKSFIQKQLDNVKNASSSLPAAIQGLKNAPDDMKFTSRLNAAAGLGGVVMAGDGVRRILTKPKEGEKRIKRIAFGVIETVSGVAIAAANIAKLSTIGQSTSR